MQKITLRRCATCNTVFIPRTKRNLFCSRKCFERAYYHRAIEVRFPTFCCPQCRTNLKLDFFPKSGFKRWSQFRCPNCGYSPAVTIVEERRQVEVEILFRVEED